MHTERIIALSRAAGPHNIMGFRQCCKLGRKAITVGSDIARHMLTKQ